MIKPIYLRPQVEAMGRAGANTYSEAYWAKVLNKFSMMVDPHDTSVAPHLINDGFWESWITTWLMNRIDANTCFLDVGAHMGYYSFLASSMGATVFAFEPNPAHFKLMNSTIARTHTKTVFVQPFALSNYNGVANLHVPTQLTGSASLSSIDGYETEKIPVTVTRLDELSLPVDRFEQTIVKIDAEGEEERILEGAREFLDKAPHCTVLLEYTPHAYSDEFVDRLFSNYVVNWINHDGLSMACTPGWVRAQTDWVMLVLQPV